ncbi:hypothetical protein RFI_40060, partial [Reticulomyxa filosa]
LRQDLSLIQADVEEFKKERVDLELAREELNRQFDYIQDASSKRRNKYSSAWIDSKNPVSFWISSFCLVLKTESIEALIMELANQRILHKLQSFIESIQKTGIIIETVKKEESEKIMDLFQSIITLFASTLNQAQIFSCLIYFSSVILTNDL